MKILHTADWHIGKILHHHDLVEDHLFFFDWMIKTIKEEQIDVLLVAGDIFERANPSTRDQETYYQILMKLISLNIKVIITGGNHDSVGMLDAPKSILRQLDIHIIGGVDTEDPFKEIIPIFNKQKELQCLVLAVPFLRDGDIKRAVQGESYEDRYSAVRMGIKQHYAKLYQVAKEKFPVAVPCLAMGHLYVQSVATSDSERTIQLGNVAGITVDHFPAGIDYVALGHIHRPQKISNSNHIRYAGSPISLSFSEWEDQKSVTILDVDSQKINSISTLPIPKSREMKRFKGTLSLIKSKVQSYCPDFPNISLVELDIQEDKYDPLIHKNLEEFVSQHSSDSFKIIKRKLAFTDNPLPVNAFYKSGENVEDLKPSDIFSEKMKNENVKEEERILMLGAFEELMQNL